MQNPVGQSEYDNQSKTTFNVGQGQEQEKENFQRIKEWLREWKQHKYVPASRIDGLNASTDDYKSFRLQIVNLRNLGQKPSANSQLAIKVYGHFFSKKVKKFFGRSMESGLCYLQYNEKSSLWQLADPEGLSIYYYTRVDPSSDCIITLEVYLFEIEGNEVTKNTTSLGYAILPMLERSKNRTDDDDNKGKQEIPDSQPLRQGSPRELIVSEAQGRSKESYQLEYFLNPCIEFNRAKYLVPESCLIGSNDTIPGLMSPCKFPCRNDDQILPDNKGFIVVQNVQVYIPDSVVNEVKNIIQQQVVNEKSHIEFKRRRLCCALHNSWTLVNSNGMDNSMDLQASSNKQDAEGKQVQGFESNSKQQIDRIFSHRHGVLVFQLEQEYDVKKDGKKNKQSLILGYLLKPIMSVLGNKEFLINMEDFIMGKGKTLDSRRLTELHSQDSIKLSLSIDASVDPDIGPEQSTQPRRSQQRLPSAVPKRVDSDDDQDFQQKPRYNKTDNQFRQRQQQEDMGQQQNMAQTQQFHPQQFQDMSEEQFSRIDERLQNQQSHFNKQIKTMKRENQELLETTTSQFKEIKKLMFQLEKTQKQSATMAGDDRRYRGKDRRRPSYGETMPEDMYVKSEQDRQREKMINTYQSIDRSRYIEQDKAYKADIQYNARDLKTAEITYLESQGVRGLLDDANAEDQDPDAYETEEGVIKQESNDGLKANEIQIKFISIKPRLEEIQGNQENKKNSVFNDNFCIPDRLRFSMNFYDFPKFESDSVSYENAGNIAALNKKLLDQQQIVLLKETYLQRMGDQREAAYSYMVDPSEYNYNGAHRDFVKYLYKKSMHIDIWDADTLMLYGTIKVPLNTLLRKGNHKMQTCKEYDIIDPNFSRIKGGLIIQMTNVGRQPQVQQTQQSQNNANQDVKMKNTFQNANKKKVKSTAQVKVPTQFKTKDVGKNKEDTMDAEERRQYRIAKFKHKQLQEALNDDKQIGQGTLDLQKQSEAKKRLLEEINEYKNTKKEKFVKSVLSQFLSDEKLHQAFFGKQDIISYQFTNTNNKKSSYHIQIKDPDEEYIKEPELQLIQKRTEWEHWVTERSYQAPSDFEQIQQGYMTLEPGETITLLFKFLTYRKQDPNMVKVDNVEELVEEKDNHYRETHINTRTINVFISETDKQVTSQGFKLKVQPHMQVIDHFFRYYERENRLLSINLPSLYHATSVPKYKPVLHCTNRHADVDWVGSNEVALKIKAPQAGKIQYLNILAYSDGFKTELLGNWQIEIHALKGIELVNVKMGQKVPFKLAVDADIQRTVKFYSSHPFIVGFREKDQEPKSIQPNRTEIVEAIAKSYSEAPKKVQVNCVDIQSKDLVHSWIISVETDAPTVSKVFNIDCIVGQDNFHRFLYYNRSADPDLYYFESSDPELIEIQEPQQYIDGGKKEPVKIKIPSKEKPGIAECFIFAQDDNDKNFEVLLFKIKYKLQNN